MSVSDNPRSTLGGQLRALRYRLFIVVFGALMALGSLITEYYVAAVFFALVAVAGIGLAASKYE